MNKIKKFISSPRAAAVSFVLAVVLLLFSSVGGARAALTYYSETYVSRVQMYDIGVSLLENGEKVSWRDYNSSSNGTWNETKGTLLGNMLAEGESLVVGRKYDEKLSVNNSGTINQYVRVSIYKYWTDAEGNKIQDLSPDLIHLDLVNVGSDWLLDQEASTAERTVLYYSRLLNSGETSSLFADGLTIDNMIATKAVQTVETEGQYTTITTAYDYDGVKFCLEAKVDAVQEHNAQDAAWSAWGRKVAVDNGTLSLK